MPQDDKTLVLQDIAEELRNKYGKEPGIFHEQQKVILENAAELDAPIIKEEVEEIVLREIQKFSLNENELAYTIIGGNIIIAFANN